MGESRERYVEFAATLAVIVLCAYMIARGSTVLASEVLLGSEEEDAAQARVIRPMSTAAFMNKRDADPILKRNIFDSESGPLDGSAAGIDLPGNSVAYNAPIDPLNPPPACSGALKLVGSLFWGKGDDGSLVAIRGSSGIKTYRVGEKVDSAEIALISADWVAVRQSGGPCTLRMFGDAGGAPPQAAPKVSAVTQKVKSPTTANKSDGISDSEYDQSISKSSDTSYTIRRSLVDKLLVNRAELMRSARIVPFEENGRVVGIKLYGIRQSSLLGRIGLQNGDMLKTINGFDMTSPDSALEAYARLRSADRLTVSIVRRGSPTTLDYTIN